MLERIRIDETSHPVDIKLRRILKGHFLEALDKTADKHSENIPKKYGLVIYGSTVMRQLVQQEDAYFKFGGLKSSDIDIGGYVVGETCRNTTNTEEFERLFAPILRETISRAGFELWLPQLGAAGDSSGTIKNKYTNGDIANLNAKSFIGDYYIAMQFTRSEVVKYLSKDSEYKDIEPYIMAHFDTKGREYKTICIAISAHAEHFPAMMEPTVLFGKTDIENYRIARPRYFDDLPLLGRARRLDMLAGKLARSMSPTFKPSDLLDIYNLVTGYSNIGMAGTSFVHSVDDTDIIDMEVIRLLTLNYLVCGYGYFDGGSPNLLDNFKDTPENRTKMVKKLKTQIIEYKQEWLFNSLGEILETVSNFVAKVFKVKSEAHPFGPLNLTMGERNYIGAFNGKAPVKAIEVQSARTFLQRLFGNLPPSRTELVQDGEARFGIDIDKIREIFPCVFGFAHPKMEAAIKSNTILNAKLEENKYGKRTTETPGDF